MKPEVGQLTVNDRIAIGKAASFLRFQAAYSVDTTESARQEWRSTAEALTDIERRCQAQPAEDPDEWVIQDRVPIRVQIDRCWYMDGECGLPADPEDMWQKYNKDQFLDGKKHGDYVRDGGGTLHVMCRRRDLPKVEQVEQWPKYYTTNTPSTVAFVKRTSKTAYMVVYSSGVEEPVTCREWDTTDDQTRREITESEAMALLNKPKQCAVGCHGPRCPNPALQDKDHCSQCADWSYHEKQKPEPQKTMLRLWIDSDCNVHAGLKNDGDLELLYDHETRQFYTEEPS